MKILMVNKFLYPNGGSETYIFKLGEYLISQGHEVQYFGMEHKGRCVGNRVNAYTSDMDFHGGSKLAKLTYPIKTIYSFEARKQIRKVLEDFQPDVVHLNNFNYQITPSVILEIIKWRNTEGRRCRIVYTAHDYQLVCPNHMLKNPNTRMNCERCTEGKYYNCIKGKCIHGSFVKSLIGAIEGFYWNYRRIYQNIDRIICISKFEESKIRKNAYLAGRTTVLYNFSAMEKPIQYSDKKQYVLFYGRFSEEKGFRTLVDSCKRLPNIEFIFAGSGPLEGLAKNVKNIKCVGFKTGNELIRLIAEAKFVVVPSEWYEPFGLTIIEAQSQGTPVIGANIGAIPELVQNNSNGLLFEVGNVTDLSTKISLLWNNEEKLNFLIENCKKICPMTLARYYERIMKVYND